MTGTRFSEVRVTAGMARLLLALFLIASMLMALPAGAQGEASGQLISGDTGAYHFEWNGSSGRLLRAALNGEPATSLPVTLLYVQQGPNGFSRYLAWFLARSERGFNILWCYLDQRGDTFGCWLYRYPVNEITYQRFRGSYRFSPGTAAGSEASAFQVAAPSSYQGPRFHYAAWDSTGGQLSRLELRAPQADSGPGGLVSTPSSPVLRTLTALHIDPLHYIRAGDENGWQAAGWEELHALARTDAGDAYYLVLYSQTTIGYAVDLNQGRVYTADFGERVRFDSAAVDMPGTATKDRAPAMQIERYRGHSFPLRASVAYANPYSDVALDVEFASPGGDRSLVPGYYTGDGIWMVRFAPNSLGTWTWKALSSDPKLNGLTGDFDCVSGESQTSFVRANPSYSYSRHFARAANSPFLPEFATGPAVPATHTPVEAEAAWADYARQIDALAARGVNRLVGGYLFDTASGADGPFLDKQLTQLNPEWFRALDRRVEYCNSKGIVPDIGLASDVSAFLAAHDERDVRRVWLYVLARYAASEVAWNLFGAGSAPLPDAVNRIASLGELTRLYDPYHHPLTTTLSAPIDRASVSAGLMSLPWMSVITVAASDVSAIGQADALNKPIVLAPLSAAAPSLDVERRALWRARMLGYYYVPDATGAGPAAIADKFFRTTRYWRLKPATEAITGENDSTVARRKRADVDAMPPITSPEEPGGAVAPPTPGGGNPATKAVGTVRLLADTGREYVLYFEGGGRATLDLLEAAGDVSLTWLNTATGATISGQSVMGGGFSSFQAPDNQDWVLRLVRK